jgi:hypothetical protein
MEVTMTRRLVLTMVVAVFTAVFAPPALAQSQADEDAIRRVLLAETDRFFARDFEGWASTFVQVPAAVQAWNNADGTYTHRLGWDTISARIREFIKNNAAPDTRPMVRENFVFRHYGNAAFVTFDKYIGDRKTVKPIREIRVVERVGAEWKIVCLVALMDHLKPALD